jgi:O-antigen ligase
VRERPWTGYGYEAVWGRHGATLLPHIAITAHRSAATAHNDIVNVATELGLPAAVVACVYLLGTFSAAARHRAEAPSPFSSFALLFFVGFTVSGGSESHMLRIHSLSWILFVAIAVAQRRALARRARAHQSSSPMGRADTE